MNLPLSIAFTESHRFWVVMFSFSFISMYILISFFIYFVICWLFRSVLFSLHMLVFLIFFFFFSWSWHLILLHCDQKRCLKCFQIFLNLPRLDLWPRMWYILENVPCALKKKVKIIVLGWNVLWISIKSNWSIASFKVCVSLLIFCLVDLSICVGGILKSPTIIVLLLISPFILVSICLTYCGAPMLDACIFIIVISSSCIYPLIIM